MLLLHLDKPGVRLRAASYILRAPVICAWLKLVGLFAAVLTSSILASDWPQFLGPTRNGVYGGTALPEAWPKEGPPVVWQKKVGQGFSGPVVKAGKLIIFHRVENKEIVECLEARNGKPVWI